MSLAGGSSWLRFRLMRILGQRWRLAWCDRSANGSRGHGTIIGSESQSWFVNVVQNCEHFSRRRSSGFRQKSETTGILANPTTKQSSAASCSTCFFWTSFLRVVCDSPLGAPERGPVGRPARNVVYTLRHGRHFDRPRNTEIGPWAGKGSQGS